MYTSTIKHNNKNRCVISHFKTLHHSFLINEFKNKQKKGDKSPETGKKTTHSLFKKDIVGFIKCKSIFLLTQHAYPQKSISISIWFAHMQLCLICDCVKDKGKTLLHPPPRSVCDSETPDCACADMNQHG